MKKRNDIIIRNEALRRHKGLALLLTLVVLVLLTTIVYTLTSKISLSSHRQQYMIDYQIARYACDSAMKYALVAMSEIQPQLKARQEAEGLYDFSDLFHLTPEEYQQLLYDRALYETQLEMELEDSGDNTTGKNSFGTSKKSVNPMDNPMDMTGFQSADPNLASALEALAGLGGGSVLDAEPNNMTLPGPYGPPWPYITEPMEFKIGESEITIEIEDENAKYPVVWALSNDKKNLRVTQDSLQVFCEWMQMDYQQIETLIDQINTLKKQKSFALTMKPIITTQKVDVKQPYRSRTSTRTSKTSPKTPSKTSSRTRTIQRTVKKSRPALAHSTDFARLLNANSIDTELLAIPLSNVQGSESALKYMSLWGAQKININSAPRHVLEAAFTFGGDAAEIAQQIIQKRKTKPFVSIDQLQSDLYQYSDSIKKAKPYIKTQSNRFTIRVTARSGNARTVSVAAVLKNGKNIQKYALISE